MTIGPPEAARERDVQWMTATVPSSPRWRSRRPVPMPGGWGWISRSLNIRLRSRRCSRTSPMSCSARSALSPADTVVKAFPGTQVASTQHAARPQWLRTTANPSGLRTRPHSNQRRPSYDRGRDRSTRSREIKGTTTGEPFPDWALKAFAEKGVTEVYDNRHMFARARSGPGSKPPPVVTTPPPSGPLTGDRGVVGDRRQRDPRRPTTSRRR